MKAIVGYPASLGDPRFTWDNQSPANLETLIFDDLVDLLVAVRTGVTDIVLQAVTGMTDALRLTQLLKHHTDAAIHLRCASPSPDELAIARELGVRSVHDVTAGGDAWPDTHSSTSVLIHADTDHRSLPDLTVGSLRVDRKRHKVFVGFAEQSMTKIEFGILSMLCESPGIIVTRSDLLANVWGDSWFGAPNLLDTHITHLRSKLRKASCDVVIGNVRSVGFFIEIQPADP